MQIGEAVAARGRPPGGMGAEGSDKW
jgi:hypothetical protein